MKYSIVKNVLWQETDGEIVIVAPKQDPAYLNESGSDVWKLIDKGFETKKIIETLAKEYNEDSSVIEKDINAIIKELLDNKYIKVMK